MKWDAVVQFILKILTDDPELLVRIIAAILKAVQKDPVVASQLLQTLVKK